MSGGPDSVTQSFTPRIPKIVFELGVPILGICYGMQILAQQLGGQVISAEKEFGHTKLTLIEESMLFEGISKYECMDESWRSGARFT